MKDYTLSKEKIAELEKVHRSLRDKRQADRGKAVIAHIDKLYRVRYSVSGVTYLRHPLGFSYKIPTHQQATLVRYIKEPKNLEKYKFLYEGKEKTPSGWTVRHDVFITIGEWPHVKRGEGKRKLESLGHADRLRHEGVRFDGSTKKNSHKKAKYAQKTTKK